MARSATDRNVGRVLIVEIEPVDTTPLARSPHTPTNSPNLSNSDQTAVGLLAIIINIGGIGEGRARSIRTVRQRHLTQEEETENADQSKWKWMQFTRELKRQHGKFTDDDLSRSEETARRLSAKFRNGMTRKMTNS